jgi:hypothetical protein
MVLVNMRYAVVAMVNMSIISVRLMLCLKTMLTGERESTLVWLVWTLKMRFREVRYMSMVMGGLNAIAVMIDTACNAAPHTRYDSMFLPVTFKSSFCIYTLVSLIV